MGKYQYNETMLEYAHKLKIHCKVQQMYRGGCRSCVFIDNLTDDLDINKDCPLSTLRPELWDLEVKR